MRTTELISLLLDDVSEHGDREVRISLRSGTMPVADVYGKSSHFVFLRTRKPEELTR